MIAQLGDLELSYEHIHPQRIINNEIVLLFLHEALGSIGQWKDFPILLCNDLNLGGIVYERQGHGYSSEFTSPRDHRYLHDYALKELPSFINKVLPDKKIILIGHSDGGSIALLYAHEFPENVLGIVTMAAHVINEPETIEGIAPAIDAFESGKLDGLKKYHGEKTKDLFYAWADTWRSEEFIKWNIENEIGSSTIPGLFIQGADDQYGTPDQLKLILQGFPNNSKAILLDNCGHHPHLEKKVEVISIITDWISNSVSIS